MSTSPQVPNIFNTSARALEALSHPIRVGIMCTLGGRGRMSVADLSSHFTVSRPAISHHLKVMLDAGILSNEKAGQEIYYWVNCDGIVNSLRALADAIEQCCGRGCCSPGNVTDSVADFYKEKRST